MLPFLTIQRQRCIKFSVLRAQDFYTPLALNCPKGQQLTALEVYKNQSPKYFCKSMPSSWQKVVYTPPICIRYASHLCRDASAEVLGSGVVGTFPTDSGGHCSCNRVGLAHNGKRAERQKWQENGKSLPDQNWRKHGESGQFLGRFRPLFLILGRGQFSTFSTIFPILGHFGTLSIAWQPRTIATLQTSFEMTTFNFLGGDSPPTLFIHLPFVVATNRKPFQGSRHLRPLELEPPEGKPPHLKTQVDKASQWRICEVVGKNQDTYFTPPPPALLTSFLHLRQKGKHCVRKRGSPCSEDDCLGSCMQWENSLTKPGTKFSFETWGPDASP